MPSEFLKCLHLLLNISENVVANIVQMHEKLYK